MRPINDLPEAGDNRYTVTSGRSYRLNVLNNDSTAADVGETLSIVGIGNSSAGGKITSNGSNIIYTPAAGFTGSETFSYTVNDGTPGSNATATVAVRVEPAEPQTLDLRDFQVDGYGGGQDLLGAALVQNSGQSLRLVGNTWKKINLPYTITPDTVLEFDFASTSEGEIHGIGLDNNATITSSRTFRLFGTQDWGIDDFDVYASRSGTQHYVIPVGRYYTGSAAYLFFVNDHDAANPVAESLFSNLRLYEASPSAALHSVKSPTPPRAADSFESMLSDALFATTGDYFIGGDAFTHFLGSRSPAVNVSLPTTDATSPAAPRQATESAAAPSQRGQSLVELHERLCFHALDHDTLAALDDIFAALGSAT